VDAFTSARVPSPDWLPLRPDEYGSEQPTPSQLPLLDAEQLPHTVPCSAVNPCLPHPMPICSMRPFLIRYMFCGMNGWRLSGEANHCNWAVPMLQLVVPMA
jgi:hypothetical protein